MSMSEWSDPGWYVVCDVGGHRHAAIESAEIRAADLLLLCAFAFQRLVPQ